MKLAILYAGQGSQHPGMGKDLYERYPAFREAFNAADLDFDLESVCFDDPEGVLNLTQYTQPCMVAFAAGVTAVLKETVSRPTIWPVCRWANTPRWKPPVSSRPSRLWSWLPSAAKPWPTPPRASSAA